MEQTYETRTNALRIRLLDSERKVLDEAAARTGLGVSAWGRMVMLEAARVVADGRGTEGV